MEWLKDSQVIPQNYPVPLQLPSSLLFTWRSLSQAWCVQHKMWVAVSLLACEVCWYPGTSHGRGAHTPLKGWERPVKPWCSGTTNQAKLQWYKKPGHLVNLMPRHFHIHVFVFCSWDLLTGFPFLCLTPSHTPSCLELSVELQRLLCSSLSKWLYSLPKPVSCTSFLLPLCFFST